MTSRGYINNSNLFCCNCGGYVVKKRQRNIIDFFKKAYYAYFGMKLVDQEKKCASCIVCHTCIEHSQTHGNIKSIPFATSMVWWEAASQENCYLFYQLRSCMGYFKAVTQKFFGNYKDPNYTMIIEKML